MVEAGEQRDLPAGTTPSGEEAAVQRASVVTYVVGLGGTGSAIVGKFTEMNIGGIGEPTNEELKKGVGRAKKTAFINIIDMVTEPEVRKLIERNMVKPEDDVIIGGEILPPEAYDLKHIYRVFGKLYMPNLLKYFPIIKAEIKLQRGGGTSRFRPLARYFIYYGSRVVSRPFLQTLIHDITARDFEDKIAPLRPRSVNVIYNLSLGGGFGSGSLLDIHTIVEAASKRSGVKIDNEFINVLIPVGYTVEPDPSDLVGRSIENSRASAAAALLELLYVASKEMNGYSDSLIDIVSESMGFTEPIKARLGDMKLFIASYSGLHGSNIEEVYREIDERSAALNTVLAYVLPDVATDVQQWQVLFPQITQAITFDVNELIEAFGFRKDDERCRKFIQEAPQLLMPVAVYNAKIIRMNYDGVISQNIINIISEIKRTREELDQLRAQKKELERKISMLDNSLRRARELLDKIKVVQRIDDDIKERQEDIVKGLDGVKDLLRQAIEDEEHGWAPRKRHLENAKKQWSSILPNINALIGVIDNRYVKRGRGFSRELAEIREQSNSADSIDDLEEVITRLHEKASGSDISIHEFYEYTVTSYKILDKLMETLKGVTGDLDTLHRRAREDCGFIATLLRSSQCRVVSISRRMYNEIAGVISSMTKIMNNLSNVMDRISDIYETTTARLKGLIEAWEKEKKEKQEKVEDVAKSIKELEEKDRRLKESLEKEKEDVIRELMKKNSFISLELATLIANDLIKGIFEDEIEVSDKTPQIKGDKYRTLSTLNGLRKRYGIDASKAIERMITRITNTIRDWIESEGDILASIDESLGEVIAGRTGLYSMKKVSYIIASKDEYEMLKEQGIIDELKKTVKDLEDKGRIDHISGSLIAVVTVLYGVPLISIKEVRKLLWSYDEEVNRVVYQVKKVKGKVIKYTTDERQVGVRERRGEMYHAILPEHEDDFKRFVESAINLMKCYEDYITD